MVPPTRTFSGSLDLAVGDRVVQLMELGPAHTKGDVIAWLPDAEVVFTGDLLFHGGHPIVWAGPIAGWIEACDRIVALAPEVVVPGHGPVTGSDAVRRMGDYFRWLEGEAAARRDTGMSAPEAAADIHRGLQDTPYGEWGESERLVINVTAAYRDLGEEVADDVVTMFTQMAELAGSPAG
jgi:glyoxylase-like metal-dependent hydrolase (beta-lactamase superfamily II)